MLRFGLELFPNTSVEKLVGYAVTAEQLGVDNIWVTDHYSNQNVYVVLDAIAAKTTRVKIGPGITNPYLIHPAWTASAITSLDEVSKGRSVLGLGPGDEVTLNTLGTERIKPLDTMKEAVQVIRRLLSEKRVDFVGDHFRLSGAGLRSRPERKIPIYIGAQGPKMLDLASKIGDGVLINASHPRDFEYAMKYIGEGAEEAGRSANELDIVAYTCMSVDSDREEAKKNALPIVAFIVAGSPGQVLERHHIQIEKAEKVKNALASGNFGAAVGSVTSEMIEAFSIVGTPADCVGKIEALVKKGVTQFVAGSPIGPKKSKSIELFAMEIASSFK